MGLIADTLGENAEQNFNAVTPDPGKPKEWAAFAISPVGAAVLEAKNTAEEVNKRVKDQKDQVNQDLKDFKNQTVGEFHDKNPQLELLNPNSDNVSDDTKVKEVVETTIPDIDQKLSLTQYKSDNIDDKGAVVETTNQVSETVDKTVKDIEKTVNNVTPDFGNVKIIVAAVAVIASVGIIGYAASGLSKLKG